MHSKNINRLPHSQHGASLLVALVVLIVLTTIGISSVSTSVLEVKMSSSSQRQSIAFNRADEALKLGLRKIKEITHDSTSLDFMAPGDGYYLASEGIDLHQLDWSGIHPIDTLGDGSSAYVIEYLGPHQIPGSSNAIGGTSATNGDTAYVFRVTARSDTDNNDLRLVQTRFIGNAAP